MKDHHADSFRSLLSQPGSAKPGFSDRLRSPRHVSLPPYYAFLLLTNTPGGRTAWSCVITVQGTQVPARFWYAGEYVNNAREDAAEKALQVLGVIPTPPGPQPAHLRQQQQQQQPQQSAQFYGAIRS